MAVAGDGVVVVVVVAVRHARRQTSGVWAAS